MAGKRRFVICLDGTWKNPYEEKQRDDGTRVLKPANPLKIARAVKPYDPATERMQIAYYSPGVGGQIRYPGTSSAILRFVDRQAGGIWGGGFEIAVEAAANFLANNFEEDDEIFVFGFSRGAAQAQALTRFLDWMGGIPEKKDAYFLPMLFREYLTSQGTSKPANVKTSSGDSPVDRMLPANVMFLGVFDTVLSLGGRFRLPGTGRSDRAFHVGELPPASVRHTRQALAIDEQRHDFVPEVWKGCPDGSTLEQRWYAGVHSNIGGGYVRDGLANLPLRWILQEAEQFGLAVDWDFVAPYNPFPQDVQYNSRSLFFRLMDRVRRRDGIRPLTGYPADANMLLDRAVIHRLMADPKQFKRLREPYRPENVRQLLSRLDDLDGYLARVFDGQEVPEIPNELRTWMTSAPETAKVAK